MSHKTVTTTTLASHSYDGRHGLPYNIINRSESRNSYGGNGNHDDSINNNYTKHHQLR